MIGRVIGQYQITAKLGEGGMGVVYRATDLALRRDVALKFIREQIGAESDAHARFLAEARAAAALNHPSICTVYQVLEAESDDGAPGRVPVLAMELVPGETLATRLEHSGPFAIDEALRLGLEVAEGLAEAHGHGVIHRDLKPHNVMTAGGRAKILDFGLSKPVRLEAHSDVTTQRAAWTGPHEAPGQIVGTVSYMAPEQALGRSTDARADVFSFGVMLYELVTGKRPFQGTETAETLARVIAADFTPPSALRPGLPAALEQVIRRCLQKDPANRYPTATELAADLRRVQITPATRRTWPVITAAVVVIAAIAAIQFWPGRASGPPAGPAEYIQVSFVNDASYPAISKDGSLVAYVRGEPWGELFATVAARAPQKVVIHDLASNQVIDVGECKPCLHPQWSSDGASLFLITQHGVTQFSRLGGVIREFPGERLPFLTVAPGGAAFATARQDAEAIQVTDTRTSAVSRIPVAGERTSIRAIDWAPTGDRLAVLVANKDRYHIWTVSRSGQTQTTVAEDVGRVSTIKWNPDGNAIYYLKISGLSRDLWKVPVNPRAEPAGPPELSLGGLQGGPNFSIAQDGKSLAYTRETRFANLWTTSITSGVSDEPTQLTTGTRLDQYPSISPDGTNVAFVRSDGRASDVYVMPRRGGPATRISFLEGVFGAPAWSPDGKRLAFCADQKGLRRVWTIPAAGGPAAPLEATNCTALESEVPVSWAPAADILYQRDGNRNYHRVNAATGKETPLLADPTRGWLFGPRTRDGLVTAMWNEKTNRGLWIFGPGPQAERFVTPHVWPAAWSADGSTIIGYEDQRSAIVSVSARDGRVRELRNLQGRRIALVPAVAPDLRSIVYSAHSILADVWIIRNFESR